MVSSQQMRSVQQTRDRINDRTQKFKEEKAILHSLRSEWGDEQKEQGESKRYD